MSLCSQSPSGVVSGGESCLTGGEGGVEIMLFGVRVKVDPMRKSVSMNNLSEYEPVDNSTGNPIGKEFLKPSEIGSGAAGYASADDAVRPPASGSAERKRGVPWTEEEHKLFLLGLQNVGKGDWRGISRNFVKTRTPTQVASHAQKYFLRQSNLNRRRRRSSLFDITTDSVNATPMEEVKSHQEGSQAQPLPVPSNINGFSVMPFPMAVGTVLLSIPPGGNPMENSGLAQSGDGLNNSSAMLVNQVPFVPIMPTPSPGLVDFNLNEQVQPLSLRLSLSSGPEPLLTSGSPFQVMMPSFENGDSIISVA